MEGSLAIYRVFVFLQTLVRISPPYIDGLLGIFSTPIQEGIP